MSWIHLTGLITTKSSLKTIKMDNMPALSINQPISNWLYALYFDSHGTLLNQPRPSFIQNLFLFIYETTDVGLMIFNFSSTIKTYAQTLNFADIELYKQHPVCVTYQPSIRKLGNFRFRDGDPFECFMFVYIKFFSYT